MEGPSLYLAVEQLKPFQGKRIQSVEGNTKIDKEQFVGKTVRDIFSWGKHLVFQFDPFALRVHFLLFGTFAATVKGKSITGDYKKARVPRLAFDFSNGRIEMYNCSIKVHEGKDFKQTYNFSIDVMSPTWDEKEAYKNIKQYPEEQVADVLLDQTIFAGVGNIIKNEVLLLTKTSPFARIEDLSPKKIKEIIKTAHDFSWQFYEWRKVFLLRKHLKIYQKKTCPICGGPVTRQKTGKRNRWSFFCNACQMDGVR